MKITEKHTVSVTSILTGEANLGITGWNKKHRTSNKQTNKQTNKNKTEGETKQTEKKRKKKEEEEEESAQQFFVHFPVLFVNNRRLKVTKTRPCVLPFCALGLYQ